MKGKMFGECAWIVQTLLDRGGLSIKELNELWIKTDMSGGVEMDKRTFHRHKHTIADTFGIKIACEDRGRYRHYISNRSDLGSNSATVWLINAIAVSERLMQRVRLHDRILVDPIPTSDWRFDRITDAMNGNRWITFGYLPYKRRDIRLVDIMPYCLKVYRQRWYLLGRYEDGGFGTYCLDRMKSLEINKKRFKMDKKFNAEAYFSEIIGIVMDKKTKTESIIVRAFGDEPRYLRDAPMHKSQTEIGSGDGFSDFSYLLKPNLEFIGYILQRGERLELLSPQHLRLRIRETILKMADIYGD